VRSNCRLCGSAGECEHFIRRIDCKICGGPCDCGSGKAKSKCVPCREKKKAALAEEAAKLAAQLGVSVPELTIPPSDVPLLHSHHPAGGVVGIGVLKPKLNDNSVPKPIIRATRKEISGSSAFQGVTPLIQKPPGITELSTSDVIPNHSSGMAIGGDLGSMSFQKCANVDSNSMQTIMPSVYDLSNALLVAARLEVQEMMRQIAAQNALSDQAISSHESQSFASVPLPTLSDATPAIPSAVPAHLLFPSTQAFPSTFSSASLAKYVQNAMMRPVFFPDMPVTYDSGAKGASHLT
jgi:hypothetical protein